MNQIINSDSNSEDNSTSVRLTPEEVAVLFKHSLRVKQIKVVTEQEYTDRIEACLACPALQYGTTCQHCGCLVHMKAKLRASKCPFPYAPKWSIIGAPEMK